MTRHKITSNTKNAIAPEGKNFSVGSSIRAVPPSADGDRCIGDCSPLVEVSIIVNFDNAMTKVLGGG